MVTQAMIEKISLPTNSMLSGDEFLPVRGVMRTGKSTLPNLAEMYARGQTLKVGRVTPCAPFGRKDARRAEDCAPYHRALVERTILWPSFHYPAQVPRQIVHCRFH